MNKIFFLALLLLGICFSEKAVAQATASTASIFFETDQSELSPSARQALDALIPSLLSAPDYQVDIAAFTDDRGTEQHNHQLAADRAASVQQYLAAHGLIADKAVVKNWGERKASGSSEPERQKSRRVDVAINAFYFNDFEGLMDRLSANTGQVLSVQADQEQTLTGAKGTLVIVPANAFVFPDGSAPVGKVEIRLQEAYDPAACILHNLTTLSDGKILQTGGMVEITAWSNGKELQLAEGASLTVSIPNGGNFDPNMELFYAQAQSNGGVDWKPAGQKFRKTLKPTRVELNVDPALGKRIAALKAPEYPQPTLPSFKGQMPPEPKLPVKPYKPRAPRKPDWYETQHMFGGSGEAARMSRKDLKKARRYFEEKEQQYERDSAKYVQLSERYQRNLEGYEKSKKRYAQDHKDWENELAARLNAIALYQREMSLHLYSKNLNKALKIKAKTIRSYETYSHLSWAVDDAAQRQTQLGMAVKGYSSHSEESFQESSGLLERFIGLRTMDTYGNFKQVKWSVEGALQVDTSSRVRTRLLAATGIQAISDSLQNEIREKTLLNATSPEQQNMALQGYVASVSKLGWINCDRFYNNPAEKLMVEVNEPEDATLYAVCKDIKAMLSFYRNSQGKYITTGLPKGQKITIVAIKIKDGMPQYAQFDMKVGDPGVPSMRYRSMPLRDLKEELKKLSI